MTYSHAFSRKERDEFDITYSKAHENHQEHQVAAGRQEYYRMSFRAPETFDQQEPIEVDLPEQVQAAIDSGQYRGLPWLQQPNEPLKYYALFMVYLALGFSRSLVKFWTEIRRRDGRWVPGMHMTSPPKDVTAKFVEWKWQERAALYDIYCMSHEIQLDKPFVSENRTNVIEEMNERHRLGAQAIQAAAIKTFYKRDENGKVMLDDDGEPILAEIEDPAVALRAFVKGAELEKTTRGINPSLIVLSTDQLLERRRALLERVSNPYADEEVVDAEFEVEGEDQ